MYFVQPGMANASDLIRTQMSANRLPTAEFDQFGVVSASAWSGESGYPWYQLHYERNSIVLVWQACLLQSEVQGDQTRSWSKQENNYHWWCSFCLVWQARSLRSGDSWDWGDSLSYMPALKPITDIYETDSSSVCQLYFGDESTPCICDG